MAFTSTCKVRAPVPLVYAGFYIVYYKYIGEFQIFTSKIYVGNIGSKSGFYYSIAVSIIQ
jgi:hypothetical protein